MKQVLMNAVKLAALAGTGWLLIATSPPYEGCQAAGPVRYEAATTCGPVGIITVSNDMNCEVRVEGAAAVNLPERGILSTAGSIMTSDWGLTLHEGSGDAGTGGRYCQVKHGTQAGVLSIECKEGTEAVVCSGTLTEQP